MAGKSTFNNPATIPVPLEKYGSDIILIKILTFSCSSPISKFNGKPFRNNFHRNHRSSSYPLRNKNGSVGRSDSQELELGRRNGGKICSNEGSEIRTDVSCINCRIERYYGWEV